MGSENLGPNDKMIPRTKRMTVQTTMTGVHSQGSDSKGSKSWGVGNTVRLFGRESPNLETAQGSELEALGREGGSCQTLEA